MESKKVYLVFHSIGYGPVSTMGLYSTLENAQLFVNSFIATYSSKNHNWTKSTNLTGLHWTGNIGGEGHRIYIDECALDSRMTYQ